MVLDTLETPFSAVGQLLIQGDAGRGQCTGSLIEPGVVLTAGLAAWVYCTGFASQAMYAHKAQAVYVATLYCRVTGAVPHLILGVQPTAGTRLAKPARVPTSPQDTRLQSCHGGPLATLKWWQQRSLMVSN